MPDPVITQKLHDLGLRIPDEEREAFDGFVADILRAGRFVREIDRSYAEEPSTVFHPAPQAQEEGRGQLPSPTAGTRP